MKCVREALFTMTVAAAGLMSVMQSALAGGGGIDDGSTAVPEPATALVLAAGAAGYLLVRKFRKTDSED